MAARRDGTKVQDDVHVGPVARDNAPPITSHPVPTPHDMATRASLCRARATQPPRTASADNTTSHAPRISNTHTPAASGPNRDVWPSYSRLVKPRPFELHRERDIARAASQHPDELTRPEQERLEPR